MNQKERLAGYSKVEAIGERYSLILKLKNQGRVDLGTYETARLAAVAHDVARLIFIHEKRPDSDLNKDEGTMHKAEAYLCDHVMTSLLANGTSFIDVCGLLRSGALADQFLCAQDRQTRHTGSSDTSGVRLAAGHTVKEEPRRSQAPPSAQQQHQQQQQHQPTPLPAAASPQGQAAAADETEAPGSGKGRSPPMRWLEFPTKGGGQFVSCLSERALKANMTLPAKMKQELFQTSEATAKVAAHDLQQGSTLRWAWEVRDYVKEGRATTYIHGLAPFFKHYNASTGDVMVVVASAPGAVKATIWSNDSPDALQFKSFIEQQKSGKQQKSGGSTAAGRGRKRAAEAAPSQQAGAKAARPATGANGDKAAKAAAPRGGNSAAGAAAAGQRQQAGKKGSPLEAPRPPSKSGIEPAHMGDQQQQSALAAHQQSHQQSPPKQVAAMGEAKPAKPHASQLPSPPMPPDAQARVLSGDLIAAADVGLDASRPLSCDQGSPTGQVAQSPFRCHPLQPRASTTGIEHEQQAAADSTVGGAAAAAGEVSPARMSCASLGLAFQQQACPGAQQAAPEAAAAGVQQAAGSKGGDIQDLLPDAMALAGDENGVYVAMSRLLGLIAATERASPDTISAYRRSFGQLEPSGKRWYHYSELKRAHDASNWAEVREWLQSSS